MGLVAQPLDEIKQRVARGQLEGRAACHEEGLAARIPIRAFCNRHDGNVDDAQRGQCFLRGIELPLPAVNEQQIGPRLVFGSAGDEVTHIVRRSAGVFFEQPFELPLKDFAHHPVVVSGRKIG